MQRDIKAVMDGAIGGGLGTVTMSVVMLTAHKIGLMGRLPPEIVTEAALDATGVHDEPEAALDLLTALFHLGFGVGVGALFGLVHRRLRLPISSTLQGMVFGILVWLVSYKGWVPALGIMPPPEHDQPGRPVTMVLAHWVYGVTLGLIVGQRQR